MGTTPPPSAIVLGLPPDTSAPPQQLGPHVLQIAEADDGKRIDNVLARYARHQPRDYLYRLIRTGQIRLDKKRTKPSSRVRAGQWLRLPPHFLGADQRRPLPPAPMVATLQQAIVHQDDHMLVVNKPAGIPAHCGSGYSFGVVECIRAAYNDLQTKPEARFPELVHRIDRLTSGCLLLAQSALVLQQLQQLWIEQAVEKTYLALVHKHVHSSQHTDMPLQIVEQSGSKRVVVEHKIGKPAATDIEPLAWGLLGDVPVTLVQCVPSTGRMHQIRVHCQSIGHPIVGDPLYQNKTQHRWSVATCGVDDMRLHAAQLRFCWNGQHYCFTADGKSRITRGVVFSPG